MKATLHRRRSAGVTLIELVVTIAVLAILATLAAPSFSGLMRRHRVSAAATALRADLVYAREEAVNRRAFVSVCASDTGSTCSGEAGYENGWLVYAYPAGTIGPNQRYSPTSAAHVLLRSASNHYGVAIQATDGDVVTFGLQGQLRASAGRTSMSWVVCSLANAHDVGTAESTANVHGAALRLSGPGSLLAEQVGDGGSCAP
ncbi:GspH/FimT family pseudopilin [Dyella sp. EPa41]|uniref:GspH/FimT family pseudopilin n=1 Tax=Dyella sp. EPa41 TaxID=1561194 RepID=UPI001F42F764|nr:GspH/FimT family pseudopilin [Dyella sp. EPa41]